MSDAHPIERSIKIGSPEIQEIDELREVRREVVVLPDVALQQSRIVRQAVYDLRRGEGEPFDLNRAGSGIGDSCNGKSLLESQV